MNQTLLSLPLGFQAMYVTFGGNSIKSPLLLRCYFQVSITKVPSTCHFTFKSSCNFVDKLNKHNTVPPVVWATHNDLWLLNFLNIFHPFHYHMLLALISEYIQSLSTAHCLRCWHHNPNHNNPLLLGHQAGSSLFYPCLITQLHSWYQVWSFF